MSLCVGDWMKLNCGDTVREKDGRHFGRVEAIHHASIVKVKWESTGWISEVRIGDLVKERQASRKLKCWKHGEVTEACATCDCINGAV